MHNLSIVVGGIAQRAPVETNGSESREMLCLTVSANHELVDGAPVARFVRRLTGLIEGADLLLEAVGHKDTRHAG